ncbi:helix-turn-helix domain-containing protein [Amycolatopsis vancoresmycina]|uniref:helix-turn-helix domain-containing protein n=1 Tax=Amycolatopsis vancoresmycina TaxID=208444 RepID=UPI00039F2FB9|nr:helix-turn-helix domain-containing protein [Amycolatopsis vancoresmycina]
MSYKAVAWALYEAPMLLTEKGKPDTTARLVLVAMAEAAHEDGTNAYPSPLRIHWATGLDERTVSRAIARLERAGLIQQDGTVRSGTKRWTLTIGLRRTDSWEDCQAAAEKVRRVESDRRQARRVRALSGTKNPGQLALGSPSESPTDRDRETSETTYVRDAESRRPALRVPASGTQNPDVRDATPPEPEEEPPGEPGSESGGTLPPRPLRRDDPSGHLNDQASKPPVPPADQPPTPRNAPHAREGRRRALSTCETHDRYLEADGSCLACKEAS